MRMLLLDEQETMRSQRRAAKNQLNWLLRMNSDKSGAHLKGLSSVLKPYSSCPIFSTGRLSIRSNDMELSKPRRIAKAYLLSVGIWSVLSLLTGWNYLIFDHSVNIHSTLTQMLLLAESRGLSYALLTPPIFHIVRHLASRSRQRVRYLFVYVLGAGPFMVIYACVRWLILPPWSPTTQQFVTRAESSPLTLIHDGFADIITIYFATVLAAHAYDYFERVRKQELEKSEYQQALAASELQALKTQLHPHFLFNTLHGISTLIDSDGKTAKAMIVKLSSLLRKTFEHSGSDLIPLHEELTFISEYLDLEKMRFGARFTVTWSIDPTTRQALVPQLILQPLVENAIRHGVACSREKSWVEIVSQRSDRGLELRLRNSIGGKRPSGTGVGLRNTEARLRFLYSDEATFSFQVDEDRMATAMLVLPLLGSLPYPTQDPLMPNRIENEVGDHARIDHR
jgi:two-component system LytT family sensor kinase